MDRFKLIDGVYVYFVTFTIIDWLPVFINPEPTQIIVDSMQYCIREKGLRINAYVIMPNHLHMVSTHQFSHRGFNILISLLKFTDNDA